MKITNYQRDAFIRAAMNDVPQVNYSEQMTKLVLDTVVATLPPKVRALWDDPKLRHWVKTDWNSYHRQTVTCPGEGAHQMPPKVDAELARLAAAKKEQDQERSELQGKLRAVAYSATTRKALATLLPEFEKYLPADDAQAVKTLPAVANVVADFTKAGWPKGKKPATKTAKAA